MFGKLHAVLLFHRIQDRYFQDVTLNENWNNCMDGNGQSLARCIYNCEDDESCETDCVRQFKVKTDDCPCEVRKELCHNSNPK